VPPTTDPAVAGPLPRLCRRANLSRDMPRKSHLWDLSGPAQTPSATAKVGGCFQKTPPDLRIVCRVAEVLTPGNPPSRNTRGTTRHPIRSRNILADTFTVRDHPIRSHGSSTFQL